MRVFPDVRGMELRTIRQCRTDLSTPAEMKIAEAMELVEGLGADERLTEVVVKLNDALGNLGKFQDEQLRKSLAMD